MPAMVSLTFKCWKSGYNLVAVTPAAGRSSATASGSTTSARARGIIATEAPNILLFLVFKSEGMGGIICRGEAHDRERERAPSGFGEGDPDWL